MTQQRLILSSFCYVRLYVQKCSDEAEQLCSPSFLMLFTLLKIEIGLLKAIQIIKEDKNIYLYTDISNLG